MAFLEGELEARRTAASFCHVGTDLNCDPPASDFGFRSLFHATYVLDLDRDKQLSLPIVALYISRFHFRLHGGLKVAGFRQNTFGFSAPSPFTSLRCSHWSLPTVSHSLPTEWRLRSVLSKEYIWFLCYLHFSFSLWVSFACSFSQSLSIPIEWQLRHRLLCSLSFSFSSLSPLFFLCIVLFYLLYCSLPFTSD
jgi:hypothetical protein